MQMEICKVIDQKVYAPISVVNSAEMLSWQGFLAIVVTPSRFARYLSTSVRSSLFESRHTLALLIETCSRYVNVAAWVGRQLSEMREMRPAFCSILWNPRDPSIRTGRNNTRPSISRA